MGLEVIQHKIFEIRGFKVMLDFDIAQLYNIENKRLKEAVRRNINRFPEDFMFELTEVEYDSLRLQIASLKKVEGNIQNIFLSLLQNKASRCFQVF